jgi:hypothetical protein
MYANLLATAMNADRAEAAHPCFVEVIRQLTSDEAKILLHFCNSREIYFPVISIKTVYSDGGQRDLIKHFSLIGADAGCKVLNLTQQYLDNICRLGLAEMPQMVSMTDKKVYERLTTYPTIVDAFSKLKKEKTEYTVIEEVLQLTNFGIHFCNTCVSNESKVPDKNNLSSK